MLIESTLLYFPLYKGWVFDTKPFFQDPFHALCWQYWNICQDGLNNYWVDCKKTPKWHKCIDQIKIDDESSVKNFIKISSCGGWY